MQAMSVSSPVSQDMEPLRRSRLAVHIKRVHPGRRKQEDLEELPPSRTRAPHRLDELFSGSFQKNGTTRGESALAEAKSSEKTKASGMVDNPNFDPM